MEMRASGKASSGRRSERPGRQHPRWFSVGILLIISVVGGALLADAAEGSDNVYAFLPTLMFWTGIAIAFFLVIRPAGRGILDFGAVRMRETNYEKASEPSSSAARWALISISIALAAGVLGYRLLHFGELEQTSAFFVGLPTVLSIALALTPKAKSSTGMIIKGMTIGLLLSGILLSEGFICILMAAPLFYLVGLAIGIPIDRYRTKQGQAPGPRVLSLILMPFVLLSIEGVSPSTSLPQRQTVEASHIIAATPQQIRAALAETPTFNPDELPSFLALGFPTPTAASGSGLSLGDRRVIHYGESRTIFSVAETGPRMVRFVNVLDESVLSNWVGWDQSIVRWRAVDPSHTEVTWTLTYDRRLHPSWYFAPWEHYGSRLAADYLISSLATP